MGRDSIKESLPYQWKYGMLLSLLTGANVLVVQDRLSIDFVILFSCAFISFFSSDVEPSYYGIKH